MKIFLTGRDGQIGWELCRSLAVLGDVHAFGRRDLDLAAPEAIRTAVRSIKPDVLVNAAGYTRVDDAESDFYAAMQVNGVAPGVLAEEARKCGALLLHFSTDYVFDGLASRPYNENDAPNPINAYGRTKVAGEAAIAAACDRWIVLRTSWIYGTRGKNFLLSMLRLAREKKELRVVNDQIGAPTWCRNVADAAAFVVRASTVDLESGIFHIASRGSGSWYDFANAIFETAARRLDFDVPRLCAIDSSSYPLPARRPRNSMLDTRKLSSRLGLQMPEWKVALRMCVEDLARSAIR